MILANNAASNNDSNSTINKILQNLLGYPMWVKQYYYLLLRKDISKHVDIKTIDAKSEDDFVQMFVPKPSAAYKILAKKKFNKSILEAHMIERDHYLFLKVIDGKKALIEICNELKWSLTKSASVLIECIERNMVETVNNSDITNAIYYLAGKIRLGEYLFRSNKLTLEQIEKALYAQNLSLTETGEKLKIGEILVNLGYIKKTDKDEILQLKDNGHDVCDVKDEVPQYLEMIASLQKTIELLKMENDGIKQDLIVYQSEVIDKTASIVKLQEQINKYESKSFSLKNLFGVKSSVKHS